MILLPTHGLGQDRVWYENHAEIYRPVQDFWARSDLYQEPGHVTLRVNLLLDDNYCMRVDGRESFVVHLENRRTGDTKYVLDAGIRVREGNTLHGWKDTLIDNLPIMVAWNDDEQLRIRARQLHPSVSRPVPTRILLYISLEDAIGGGDVWRVKYVAPLARKTEVIRCAN